MKIFSFRIKKRKIIKHWLVNSFIVFILLAVFAVSYAGGTLEVFNSSNKSQAIYHGNTNSKNVCLMINVYWGDDFIQPMLDIFKENNIQTTFFVGGVWASKNQVMLEKILNDGHELGNHGYYHKDQDKISYDANFQEINQNHQIVKNLVNYEMNLFAPPSGAYNDLTLEAAENLGYRTIMWTKDTIDWRDQDQNLIFERATKNAKGGDLILMHPTEKTVLALPNIIKFYQEKGFTLTTVSKVLE